MLENERGYISTRLAKSRNYLATKNNVDELMYQYEEYLYKYHEIAPPRVTQNYEVKYEKFLNNATDKVGNYVAKKLDLLKEVDSFYQDLSLAMKNLCKEELIYFSSCYFNRLPETIICEKLNIGEGSLRRIKESCIIKIAMYFDKDVKI